jgi:DNA-binding NtrC family response regulator
LRTGHATRRHPGRGRGSAEEAQRRLSRRLPGIVVTDMRLPGMDGMALLRWVNQLDADLPVIIITGHGDVTLAVEAMRSGAYDFMQKPFSTGDLVEVVRRALEKRELVLEVEALRRRLDHRDDLEARLIGRSPQMAKVRQLILDVADAAVDVLIFGETGTGKEMVARCLHDLSRAGQENYVALNCGGMADTCSTANSSATSRAPSPAPRSGASARSNTPAAARCSSTKSSRCR